MNGLWDYMNSKRRNGMRYSASLLSDFYKEGHFEQYNPDLTFLASYLTPRMSRTNDDKVLVVGIQYYIKEYLIDNFNETFFWIDKKTAIRKYMRIIKATFLRFNGREATQEELDFHEKRWRDLHDLGYLPIEIKALEEGSLCPMKCPMLEISNTHWNFVWLVNFLETSMSATLWHSIASATVAFKYRKIVDTWYDLTCDDDVSRKGAISDFSFRGQESIESSAKSSAAFLTCFTGTATIPAIEFLENYYNANVETEIVGMGLPSTEHSVMCSNFMIDGDEKTGLLRLIKETYKDQNVTIVCDSYDYWNVVTNLLRDKEVKQAILEHNGFVGIRGDSGDPVEILFKTVLVLADIFGKTRNSKGYDILNPKVKAVYGDSITPERTIKIYSKLEKLGFASNCVVLGMGSYSMQSAENNTPLTRDTYSMAIKTTYVEKMGEPIMVFKDPKTDNGNFKKSQRGMCYVFQGENGIEFTDGHTREESFDDNLLKTVFIDGNLVETSLSEIRERIDNLVKL